MAIGSVWGGERRIERGGSSRPARAGADARMSLLMRRVGVMLAARRGTAAKPRD